MKELGQLRDEALMNPPHLRHIVPCTKACSRIFQVSRIQPFKLLAQSFTLLYESPQFLCIRFPQRGIESV